MRSYPIWNIVQACIYKGEKSYGVKEKGVVTVRVGTSSSNSHVFLTHKTTVKRHSKDLQEFRFFVDGELVKTRFVKGGEFLERHQIVGEY
jgi:hypothetical protein